MSNLISNLKLYDLETRITTQTEYFSMHTNAVFNKILSGVDVQELYFVLFEESNHQETVASRFSSGTLQFTTSFIS